MPYRKRRNSETCNDTQAAANSQQCDGISGESLRALCYLFYKKPLTDEETAGIAERLEDYEDTGFIHFILYNDITERLRIAKNVKIEDFGAISKILNHTAKEEYPFINVYDKAGVFEAMKDREFILKNDGCKVLLAKLLFVHSLPYNDQCPCNQC